MKPMLLTVLLWLPLAAPAQGTPLELRYRGTLSSSGGNAEAPVKNFELYCVASAPKERQRAVAYVVEERGGGEWPWPERFGSVSLDGDGKPTDAARPRLLQDHNGTLHPVELPLPIFANADRLKADAAWNDGKLRYEVAGRRKLGERDCWQVDVATSFGRLQTLAVDAAEGVIVSVDQRIFLGQGDRYHLSMQLESIREVGKDEYSRLQGAIQALTDLQFKLDRRDGNQLRPELNERQLSATAAALPELLKRSQDTPFERLAAAIARDLKAQQQRDEELRSLAARFLDKAAPELTLKSLLGRPVEPADYAGKIVLLHFWDYQREPLVEPYGQVGYLDYLHGRRHKLGVKVYGVAVHADAADSDKSAAILRSARQLKEFMNLGYEVTVDDGTLLKKFGDPRQLGGKLPLWVLIGADGKIAHYHVGYYEIKADEGLRELDELLVTLIKRQRAAEQE